MTHTKFSPQRSSSSPSTPHGNISPSSERRKSLDRQVSPELNLSEIEAPAPVLNPDEDPVARYASLEDGIPDRRRQSVAIRENEPPAGPNAADDGERLRDDSIRHRQSRDAHSEHTITPSRLRHDDESEGFGGTFELANLAEMASAGAVENESEAPCYTHRSLEEELGRPELVLVEDPKDDARVAVGRVGRLKANIFILSHLIFFSIMGTLARLGLQGLTTYPLAPVGFDTIWPNFTGTLILGLLSEAAELLHHPKSARSIARPPFPEPPPVSPASDSERSNESAETKQAQPEPSIPIPLHIGLATGFCGSLTTFSSFMRDCFLELAGGATVTPTTPSPGQDFMSLVSVIVVTLGVCMAGLKAGAHIAIFLKRFDKRIPRRVVRKIDYIVVVLAIGCWAGAVIMAIIPPDRPSGPAGHKTSWAQETWRGEAVFALVFAPLGCLTRFLLSTKLNLRCVGFPLGTFCANSLGTLVLAVTWDLQRLPAERASTWIGGNLVSCQVLQGVDDGFCGCLTTISTWILELNALRRAHAYRYGCITLGTGLSIVVVVMGSMKWVDGLEKPVCTAL